MSFLDLIRMSSGNLWRRKLRTFLTVLGVVIGTASIVVMISLGLALNKMMMDEIESNGGLTSIDVGSQGQWGRIDDDNGQGEDKRITDETIEELKQIEHVTLVSPVLDTNMVAKQGQYMATIWDVKGMSREALEQMNFNFVEGGLPAEANSELQFIYGNMVIEGFGKAKNGYPEPAYDGKVPDVDLMKSISYIFDMDGYWNTLYDDAGFEDGESSGSNTKEAKTPLKKYKVKTAGVLYGDLEHYSATSFTVYCDIEALIPQLKKVFRNKPIPNQPTTKSGKAYKKIIYSSAYVSVDKMENVAEVQKQIKEFGYPSTSQSENIQSQQKQSRSTQLILGCIGAVSLFVAAIGITNTMMMSIYERTKEIGVIKVLGCNLSNIRTMFLIEAACIGFLGGAMGVALSYGISGVLNHFGATFLGEMMMMGMGGGVASYIPPWLSLIALVFAMLIGMIAGFFPALRAMQLSPLAAIRTE